MVVALSEGQTHGQRRYLVSRYVLRCVSGGAMPCDVVNWNEKISAIVIVMNLSLSRMYCRRCDRVLSLST